jgi:DEAD/DEAH box helicase domain-containing protein
MLDKLVIDIETKNSFADVGGQQNINRLEISIIGVYSYKRDEFFAFDEKQFQDFEKLMKESGAFIGFALKRFDVPVLKTHIHQDFSSIRILDILEEVEAQRGHRIGLDDLAQANIGTGKTGHGLEAIDMYREGRIDELKQYCLNDVKITRDLYEHGIKNGKLIIPSRYSTPAFITLNWNDLDDYLELMEVTRNSMPKQKSLF